MKTCTDCVEAYVYHDNRLHCLGNVADAPKYVSESDDATDCPGFVPYPEEPQQ